MKDLLKSEDLQRLLASLPVMRGVYLFKDEEGQIVYIGKAVNLKQRVRSYWNVASWAERPKLAVMIPKVKSVETIVTNSEKEALLLEATLVRKHMPKYNVALKDDKHYPWLAITYDEQFPRLIMIREPSKFRKQFPQSRIFGPYVEAGAMWDTVRVLRKVFPMRQRRKPLFKDRPCMNYQIGLCMGPCQGLVEEPAYNQMVKQVEMFLAGRQSEVIEQLQLEMEEQAQCLEFELAAKIRNRIYSLKKITEKQQVCFEDVRISEDILAEVHNASTEAVCLLCVREGKLISQETIMLPLRDKTRWDEAYHSFIEQYYTTCEEIALPNEVILEHESEDAEALSQVLSSRAKRQVKVSTPKKGKKLKLVEMAKKNAQSCLVRELSAQEQNETKAFAILSQLKDDLGLKQLPQKIECFDISNIQGKDNVASMVVFEGGQPKKSDYRLFKILSVEGKANDFASMKEVIGRRYKRLLKDEKPFPNLIIIDGGKGQLNAALLALEEIEGKEFDIIGLAKKEEEVFLPHLAKSVILSRRSAALHLLQAVRDEAHRFALNFHRKLRAKRSLVSNFDLLPGIGPSRRKLLIDHFGSFERLKTASQEELRDVAGLPKNIALGIYKALHEADFQSES